MIYKNFRLICTFHVILLSATIFLCFYILFYTKLYALIVIIGALIIYEIYSLIHYLEKTNRDLTRLLESIKYEDFSQTFTSRTTGSFFNELYKAFNQVIDQFRRISTEKEEHYRYLQTIVQHVGIGLIAFKQDGHVVLINTAAKRLLKISHLKNIKSLHSLSKSLVDTLFRMRPGEKNLVKIEENNELLQLAVYATGFKLRNQKFTLVSLQNIQSELEEKEMEAWQNLIRVLTHEIMNSVTPISSLASTVNDLLIKDDNINEETISDIHDAIQTIQKRSQGLLHFVDAYRKLTRIPKPNFQIFLISELFARVEKLMRSHIEESAINFTTNIDPESLELTADPELIEQVLINLLLNAIDAVQNQADPQVELRAQLDDKGRIIVQVQDNGPGVLEELKDKIFIPFFTTKKNGTGIGLALSRQIMRLHRGAINVSAEPNGKTIFTLKF